MTQSTIALTLGNITIRQLNGLFSLNDLHKAAGGEARHKPSEWLRNQQAQELVQEIGKAGIPALDVKKGGKNPGAYACRELVIAYAAWINAAFHLKVIRVFLAVTAPQPAPYSVQPSDTLSEPQQAALRTTLESNVKRLPKEKQAAAMVGGWSKLKAHFGVPYRQIPASEFTEALSIIARHVSQWELVDDTPAPQPTTPAAPVTDAARIQAAFKAAAQAGAAAQTAVFQALLQNQGSAQHGQRLLVALHPSAHVQPLAPDEFTNSWGGLVKDVAAGNFLLTNAELANMLAACSQRMAKRLGQPTALVA